MKTVCKFVLIASIAVTICIYGLCFNRLSETALVRWSYLWFPGLLFGVVGLKGISITLKDGATLKYRLKPIARYTSGQKKFIDTLCRLHNEAAGPS
jgi:hypothetical protein